MFAGLPIDLLYQASRRLQLASLVVAGAFTLALFLSNTVQALGWYEWRFLAAKNLVAAVMVGVSLLVFKIARRGLAPSGLLRVALVYEVVVALAISLGDHLEPFPEELPLAALSWLCLWIVLFPLVVPAPPRQALMAGLAAASTWPLAYLLGRWLGNPLPSGAILALNLLENYLVAALAVVPALLVRRLDELGSYQLVSKIDQGGMGEVWRARHRMLARPAAVKLIRPELLGVQSGPRAADLVRRFEREAQATALLRSPHAVELYDFGVTADGIFYYVMELLDGLDLESLVSRFGPLPPERAVHLLLQASDALAEAHAAGLIHRDVKPSNVFACRRGRLVDFVKVLDFGLVKHAADGEADTRLTAEGLVIGTPAYLAPETALGRTVDERTDVYGLGGLAYWLLTARMVFEAETAVGMVAHHVGTPPRSPSNLTAAPIPPLLDRLVLDCLSKEPDQRPRDAEELMRRLQACQAQPAWTPQRAAVWWGRHLPRPVTSSEAGAEPSSWPGSSSDLPPF